MKASDKATEVVFRKTTTDKVNMKPFTPKTVWPPATQLRRAVLGSSPSESNDMKRRSAFARIVLPLLLVCLAGSNVLGADSAPVPTLHTTDLFRPHVDPDDHWDLATQYALAWMGKVNLRGVLVDCPRRSNAPDICAVAQMNYITGKAVPVLVGAPRKMLPEELRKDAGAAKLAGVRAFLELMRQSPRPVVIHIAGGCHLVTIDEEVNLFWLNRVKKSPDTPIFDFNISGVEL